MAETWIDRYIEEHRFDPDFAIEKMVLALVGQIHQRMDELKITQEELAKRMGMSQPSVSKALRYSNNVTIRTLARIACALESEWTGFQLSHKTVKSSAVRKKVGRTARKSPARSPRVAARAARA